MGFLRRLFDKPDKPDKPDKTSAPESPMTKDCFAQLVKETLQKVGDDSLCTYDKDEFQLQFMKDGKLVRNLHLCNIFEEYQRIATDEQSKWLRSRLIGMAKAGEAPEEFEDAAHDLRPTVRSRFFFEMAKMSMQATGGEPAAMAFLPLSDYLAIALVYDLPTTMSFVTEKNLNKWNVTTYEAFERAKQNLDESPLQIAAIDNRLFISAVGDSYDSTRMLMLDVIRQLPLESAPVALPLNRECLLITGQEDIKGLGIMLDLAEQRINEPRPVCFVPHVLDGDQWDPWFPGADHPHFERFRLLKLRFVSGEYAEQKQALDKLHQRTRTDVFVASQLIVSKNGRPTHTVASWAKGVVSWLPRTDQIGFFDPETKTMKMAKWENAERIVGHMMDPLDIYPPRWSVSEFPSDEQFKAMEAHLP